MAAGLGCSPVGEAEARTAAYAKGVLVAEKVRGMAEFGNAAEDPGAVGVKADAVAGVREESNGVRREFGSCSFPKIADGVMAYELSVNEPGVGAGIVGLRFSGEGKAKRPCCCGGCSVKRTSLCRAGGLVSGVRERGAVFSKTPWKKNAYI